MREIESGFEATASKLHDLWFVRTQYTAAPISGLMYIAANKMMVLFLPRERARKILCCALFLERNCDIIQTCTDSIIRLLHWVAVDHFRASQR